MEAASKIAALFCGADGDRTHDLYVLAYIALSQLSYGPRIGLYSQNALATIQHPIRWQEFIKGKLFGQGLSVFNICI